MCLYETSLAVKSFVIPAQAGIQWLLQVSWIPAFAGMTWFCCVTEIDL